MKTTTSVSLGKCNFILDEDAYDVLKLFLDKYRKDLDWKENKDSAAEIVEEVEMRIADLFRENLHGREVVDEALVRKVITDMGFTVPESVFEKAGHEAGKAAAKVASGLKGQRRLYRDGDQRVIGGVCSGIAHHFDIDVVIVRVLFALAFVLGFAGLWIYLVFWIIVPKAVSPIEKCEMNGEPATPENLAKY